MAGKTQTMTIAPEAIVYIQLKLPLDISTETFLSNELNKKISLEVQGEAVEISEEYPLPILMAVFDVVHRISPEMVLRLKSGKRVLIFDHWSAPVLRDKDIYIVGKDKEHEKGLGKFIPELVIDLEAIWKEIGKEDDFESIKKSLHAIEKLIKPSIATTLIGKAPALLFLLTQHLLYGKTGEIWYQESSTSTPLKITRL